MLCRRWVQLSNAFLSKQKGVFPLESYFSDEVEFDLIWSFIGEILIIQKGRRSRVRMVALQLLIQSVRIPLRWGVLDTILCDTVVNDFR